MPLPIRQDYDFTKMTTFGVPVRAAQFSVIRNLQGIQQAIDQGLFRHNPLVLGGGSNMLFVKDYDGVVLQNLWTGKSVVKEDEQFVWVKAYGGEVWHEFVLYCISNGWGGIENMSLIPGSVGAAPIQNIGAYGVELKDVFESLEAVDLTTGEVKRFDLDACGFGYRESVFKRQLKGQYWIASVTLKLSKFPEVSTEYGAIQGELEGVAQPTIKDVSDAVIRIRQSKLPDPNQIGNCGSFFKNPVVPKLVKDQIAIEYPEMPYYPIDENQVKIPAGWLIEKAGWKGYRRGEIGVHQKQALVLVNHGNGKGRDIYQLSEDIIQDVHEKFGVQLEREVNVIGL